MVKFPKNLFLLNGGVLLYQLSNPICIHNKSPIGRGWLEGFPLLPVMDEKGGGSSLMNPPIGSVESVH
jgi:hypothetical protein